MARRRYISTKLSLYTWMIPHAEDDARLTGDPDEILMMVCPGRRDKSTEDIASALQAMHDLGLIEWNQEAGYVQFPASFYGYQTYITDKRKGAQNVEMPKPVADSSAKQRKTAQKTASSSLSSSLSSSVSVKSPNSEEEADQSPFAPKAADAAASPESSPIPSQKPRPVNPFWDALVTGIGHDATPSKKGAWGKAIHDLKAMDATPQDIILRCEMHRAKWPDMTLTATSLAANWHDLAPDASATSPPKGNVAPPPNIAQPFQRPKPREPEKLAS
jgi:hypothetical protein